MVIKDLPRVMGQKDCFPVESIFSAPASRGPKSGHKQHWDLSGPLKPGPVVMTLRIAGRGHGSLVRRGGTQVRVL